MGDLQLAITITRIYEGDNGPVLRELLEEKLLPEAAVEGNRWMASWAFWMLGRRDMAVRALIVSIQTKHSILSINTNAVTNRDSAFAHTSIPGQPRTRNTSVQILPIQRPGSRSSIPSTSGKNFTDPQRCFASPAPRRVGIRAPQRPVVRPHGLRLTRPGPCPPLGVPMCPSHLQLIAVTTLPRNQRKWRRLSETASPAEQSGCRRYAGPPHQDGGSSRYK